MNSPRWRGLRPWRAALALGVLGALAAGVVVHAAKRLDVDPATVSVSVEGCSLACADAFSHALGERLLAFGLRVVTSPQQGAPAVHLRIEQLEVGEGVHEDQARVVARATLSLSGTDLRESLLLEAESDDRDASLLEVALASLDMHGDDLAATILALPTIAPPDTALGLDRSDALTRSPCFARPRCRRGSVPAPLPRRRHHGRAAGGGDHLRVALRVPAAHRSRRRRLCLGSVAQVRVVRAHRQSARRSAPAAAG